MMRSPDKPTTPGQAQVIAWSVIVLLVLGGGVAFYFALAGAGKNPAAAAEIRNYAWAMWGLAAVIFAVKTAIQRWVD